MIKQNLLTGDFIKTRNIVDLLKKNFAYRINSKNITRNINPSIQMASKKDLSCIIHKVHDANKFFSKSMSSFSVFLTKHYFSDCPKNNYYSVNGAKLDDKESFDNTNKSELNILMKNNEDILSKNILSLSVEEEIKDYKCFVDAVSICRFTENNNFTKKSRTLLLNLLRYNNYSVFTQKKFNELSFINFFSVLFYLELDEKDVNRINDQYFLFKDKFNIENMITIFDKLYYYEKNNFNISQIKKDIIEILNKSYFVMSNDSNNNFHSNLIFLTTSEISKFSLFAAEKLFQYTNYEYMPKVLGLKERITYIQPLPKIISDIKYSETVPEKIKLKVINNCCEVLNRFLKNIPKNDIDDSLLYVLSNTFFYLKLNDEVLEIFLEGFYRNIAKFDVENLLEIFFLVLNVSKNEINISNSKQKLINQLFIIFSTDKTKPKIYMDSNKYFIYINKCRENLNDSIKGWLSTSNVKAKNMNENEKNILEAFKRILKLSVDIFPFATKDTYYSEEMIEDLFLTFKKIVKKI